ncbi:MAG TPA: alpha/beta hydrolase [Lachnospiraceae bacterium]
MLNIIKEEGEYKTLEGSIPSSDKEHDLHLLVWEPKKKARAIVQISHGMMEYVGRFEGLAVFLAKEGFVVIGNDHLGHGKSTKVKEELGYIGVGKSKSLLEDLREVSLYIKKLYPALPLVLFGHSMGSFLARSYAMTYSKKIEGLILSGTGYQPQPLLKTARALAFLIGKIKGDFYRSEFFKRMAFAGYLSRIKNPKTANDWLTKDEKIVEAYNKDAYCNYTFTMNGYQTLLEVLDSIQKRKNIAKIRKDLPIYFIAGKEDPVGNYGLGVKKVYESYKKAGIKDIDLKLYANDRHELTNELDKETVFADIVKWMENFFGKKDR